MKKISLLISVTFLTTVLIVSFIERDNRDLYMSEYMNKLDRFRQVELQLLQTIEASDVNTKNGIEIIKSEINKARECLKSIDFWLRYLENIAYKKINGPLPVEWETEVFEKFEKPYKREGAGLTLAALYTDEDVVEKDSLLQLVRSSIEATRTFAADSITKNLTTHDHFYLCNRLFLLNLAAIYTTGFECPDTSRIIPELLILMTNTETIYKSFNKSFPATALSDQYLLLYNEALTFVNRQPKNFSSFDHFIFIKDFVNPLFALNQQAIKDNKVISRSFMDYSLNKGNQSIFNKDLYNGLNPKGIFCGLKTMQF